MDKFRMEMQDKVNVYLNAVRKSGSINMYGAAPLIAETFGVERREAQQYLKNWMQTFGDRENGSTN